MRLARRLTFSLHAQRESKQRESAPDIRPEPVLRLFRVRSLHRRSRGTSRRDILVPSRLSRHPCRSTPYTPIPLTLLTGLPVRAYLNVNRRVDNRAALSTKPHPVEKPRAAFSTLRTGFGSPTVPVRRPSVYCASQKIRWAPKRPIEEAERRCCAAGFEAGRRESSDGPWMALRNVPAQLHRSEGSRAQRDPYPGASVFGYFCRDWQK